MSKISFFVNKMLKINIFVKEKSFFFFFFDKNKIVILQPKIKNRCQIVKKRVFRYEQHFSFGCVWGYS